jgi:hypothetical protein
MDYAVEQILARLIGQFGSPYDFCRELVQNAMDGGASRLDITFDAHPGSEEDLVFELRFDDTGRGMTAAVVRDELTRLFASSKRDDRTSAGEFGVGFVSVFGWRPDAVILQTGREGEAWELIFDGSAKFEQRRIEHPLEGTSVLLLKRGARSEVSEVVGEVGKALRRWCRYCPIEVLFEDLFQGASPELISVGWPKGDAICEDEQPLPGGKLLVSMCADPRVVLMRSGLILEEGSLAELFPSVAARLPPGAAMNLRILAESSDFETNIARDKITLRSAVEHLGPRIIEAFHRMQRTLFTRAEHTATLPQRVGGPHSKTMMHLCLAAQLPNGDVIDELDRRAILRVFHEDQPVSLRVVERGLEGLPLLVADLATSEGGDADMRRMLTGWSGPRFPVVHANFVRDLPWLQILGRSIDRGVRSAASVLYVVEPREEEGLGVCGGVEVMLTALGLEVKDVRIAVFTGCHGDDDPICGFDAGSGASFACSEFGADAATRLRGARVWLRADHAVVRDALKMGGLDPLFAATAVIGGMSTQLGLSSTQLASLADVVERDLMATKRRRLGPAR